VARRQIRMAITDDRPDDNKLTPQEFWDRRLSRHFDLQGVGCQILGRHYNAWLYRVRRRVFLSSIHSLRLDWRHARVADIGSGTGFYVELWKRLGVTSLVGLDFTPTAVSRLRVQYPAFTFVQADISKPLTQDAGGPFDAISAIDVLFHIMEDEGYAQSLRTLSAMLAPGGYLLFTDCFLHGRTQRARHNVWRPLHQIEGWLRACGLSPVRRRPVFVLMNVPADSPRPRARALWDACMRRVQASEAVGFLAGAVLFPVELLLTTVLRESPSTELLICRKEPG
jgi:SAM-dependent methyltransferase